MLPDRASQYFADIRIGDPALVRILQGDLTRQTVDAIVNAANSSLMGGGGVDGAIHRAGGPAILEECKRIRTVSGPLPAGKAIATTAGKLSAKYVIHTVGPVWRGGGEGEPAALASCYLESMQLAGELRLRSIAFPAISTGAFGYPLEHAAQVALSTVAKALPQSPTLILATFALFDRRALDTFARVAQQIAPGKVEFGTYD